VNILPQPGSGYDKSSIWEGYNKEDYSEDEDYTPRADIPHMWDIEYRHHMIDSGVDLVICHHPHIVQGYEVYNGKLIAHSLGNFAFDLSYSETFPSVILNTKIDTAGFSDFTIVPVYIDDFIPQPATGELGLYILDNLARRSKDLNTYLHIDREEITATVIMDTLNIEISTDTYQDTIFFEDIDGEWISNPLEIQKDGYLSSLFAASLQSFDYRVGREIIWFGNMEDEGCSLWNINSDDEWLEDTVAFEGQRSICHRRYHDSGDNIVTNFEKRIKKYSDGDHSLHGNIKTFGGADVTIQVRYYQSRTSTYPIGTEDIGVSLSGTNDWQFFFNELDVPDNTGYFDIRLSSDCPNVGVAYSWFDNVGIIEWTEWDPLTANEPIESPNDYYYVQLKSEYSIESVRLDHNETNYGQGPFVHSDENDVTPVYAKLYQNYPNPFNPTTTISFSLITENTEETELIVYNIKGQKVKQLLSKSANMLSAGQHYVVWNGKDDRNRNVASGVYFYKLKAGKTEITRKMVLIK